MKRSFWLCFFFLLTMAISWSAVASLTDVHVSGNDKKSASEDGGREYPSGELQAELWKKLVAALSRKSGFITESDYKQAFGVDISKANHQFSEGVRYEQGPSKDRFSVSLYVTNKYKGRYVGEYSSLIVELTAVGRSRGCYKLVNAINDLHENGWVGGDGYSTGPGMPSRLAPVNLGNKSGDYQVILTTDISGCLYSISVAKKPDSLTFRG